jgi:hypothetical protein
MTCGNSFIFSIFEPRFLMPSFGGPGSIDFKAPDFRRYFMSLHLSPVIVSLLLAFALLSSGSRARKPQDSGTLRLSANSPITSSLRSPMRGTRSRIGQTDEAAGNSEYGVSRRVFQLHQHAALERSCCCNGKRWIRINHLSGGSQGYPIRDEGHILSTRRNHGETAKPVDLPQSACRNRQDLRVPGGRQSVRECPGEFALRDGSDSACGSRDHSARSRGE